MISLAALTYAAPASPSEFVTRSGTRFVLKGQDHFVFSANYWQAMNLGAKDAAGGNRTRLMADLDELAAYGFNNLRIMASSEGPDSSSFRMTPTLQPSPGVYNKDLLDGLDFALAEMGKRNLKAVMTLNDFWHWSGGFAAYVAWLTSTPIPYPPSFSRKLNDWTTDGDWQTFIQYAARFYTDEGIRDKAQAIFRQLISMLVNRVNTYTGVAYKNDPTIFAWQLANEPQKPPAWWVDQIARYIKSMDPNHMVSTGLEGKEDESDFITGHASDAIDYTTCHIWAQNAGIYNMLDSSEWNIQNSISWATNRLQMVNQWAVRMNRPVILEEFGLARDNWVANGDKSKIYSADNPITNRNRYFQALFGQVVSLRKSGGAFAGFGFWAYAGQARPSDQWISDPPHEAPGWYAVYDKDVSTLQIIKDAYHSVTG